jgi:hypothetical protein
VLALVINKLSPGRTSHRRAAASRSPSISPP